MKKLEVFGLLVLILAFGLIFASCGENEPDTWSTPTSLDQLNGTWKGIYSEKHTWKEWSEKGGGTWDDGNEALFGNMSMEDKQDIVIVFDSAAKTYSITAVETKIFSGGKIDTIWDVIKTWSGGEVNIDDKNHSISRNYNNGPLPINETWLSDFEINQNGKKIKIPNFTGDGKDFILTKK